MISHGLTAFVVVFVVVVDQWTKALVVEYLGPPNSGRMVPVIGDYLTLYYIQNKDSAMGLLSNGILNLWRQRPVYHLEIDGCLSKENNALRQGGARMADVRPIDQGQGWRHRQL